jgi:hypothetical protein
MALPRLGSFFSENRTLAGFEACTLSASAFFKGLVGGNGTGVDAAFATALHDSATNDAAARTATPCLINVCASVRAIQALDTRAGSVGTAKIWLCLALGVSTILFLVPAFYFTFDVAICLPIKIIDRDHL